MTSSDKPERIAIVGVGGIFPGADDLDSFWTNVANGVDSGRHAPKKRWYLSPEKAFAPWPPKPDRVYSTWGCFIEDFQLRPDGLNLDPSFLAHLDPVFHLGLHAARAAYQDSKHLSGVDHSRVGVILGNIALPTESTSAICRDVLGRTFVEKLIEAAPLTRDRRQFLKNNLTRSNWDPINRFAAGLPSNLIAQGLGFGGTAFTLDAACASSLYALKFASEELLANRADAMLAGGISRPDCQYTQMGFAQLQALSKRGRCAPLSAEADGLVVGEGAGVFVLKRLSDAINSGDHIYGVIAGIGLSNDRGANLLAPHSEGQLRAMRAAYEQAGWRPSDVDLIECHATGTPVGDGVEIESLHQLWQHESVRPQQCVIGGVKSNVGHLLTGAGAAGLMKVLFAIKHRTLPPTANFTRPAEKLTSATSPFRVLNQSEPWPQRSNKTPRRATINAFGFGGINAHVLIEEWTDSFAEASVRLKRSPSETIPIAIVGMTSLVGNVESSHSTQNDGLGFKPFHLSQPNWWGIEQTDWFQKERPIIEGAIQPLPHHELSGREQVSNRQDEMSARCMSFSSDESGTQPGSQTEGDNDRQRVLGFTEVRLPMGTFRIPPLEMQDMLPQQQLMLQAASEAVRSIRDDSRNSNVKLKAEATSPTLGDKAGVFVGIELDPNTTNFHLRWSIEQDAPQWAEMLGLKLSPDELEEWIKQLKDAAGPPLTPNRVMGNLGGIVASRLAREFDVGGPSFTISCGGDSCPMAFDLAIGMLRRGELDRAIVGAVDLTCDARLVAGGLEKKPLDGAFAYVLERLSDSYRLGTQALAVFEDHTLIADSTIDKQDRGVLFTSSLNSNQRCLNPFRLESAIASAIKLDSSPWSSNQSTGIRKPLAQQGRIAFVFPGSGNAFLGMGRELLAKFPDVLRRQEVENKRLRDQYRPDLIWEGTSTNDLLANHKAMIFGQVAIGTAICDLLALFGVRPTASIGYSLGESSALFGLRAWTDRDEMLRRMEESPLFGSDLVAPFNAARKAWKVPPTVPIEWISGVIDRSANAVRKAIACRASIDSNTGDNSSTRVKSPRVYLLIINTPSQCVIGGERSEVEDLVREMGAQFVPFAAPSTVHCEILREEETAYRQLHRMNTVTPIVVLQSVLPEKESSLPDVDQSHRSDSSTETPIDFYSTAWGRTYNLSSESAAEAIVAQAVGTIDFPQVIEQAYADGIRIFVEIGPGSSCIRMIDEILGNRPHLAKAALPNTSRPIETFLELLATLKTEGVPVDMSYLHRSAGEVTQESIPEPDQPNRPIREIVTRVGGLPFEIPIPPGGWTIHEPIMEASCQTNASLSNSTNGNEMNGNQTCNSNDCHLNNIDASCLSQMTLADAAPLLEDDSAGSDPHDLQRTPHSSTHTLFDQLQLMTDHRTQAHETFLRFSARAEQLAAQHLAMLAQMGTSESTNSEVANPSRETRSADHAMPSVTPSGSIAMSIDQPFSSNSSAKANQVQATRVVQRTTPPRSLNREECMTFAIGRIGDCLGTMFEEIDKHPTRVRLPDEPLMLVDRILAIEGEPLSMTSGRVITEHDIHPNAWYLDCNRIPTCIAVESGQADLFLSGWLGIDFQTKGLACYRLLDAVVTFHDELPQPGQTIHYDIRVLHFFRQGDTYLFRFEFDATVGGKALMTMREGCAGFFTEAELAGGKGIVHTALDKRPRPGKRPSDWIDPVPMKVESYDDKQLVALRRGDLASCFGPEFSELPLRQPVTIPGLASKSTGLQDSTTSNSIVYSEQRTRMWLVDRVLKLDPNGGKFGLGSILGELDIHPDDWFLTCHFCDDQVMPGTLMYECCMHTLRILLIRMGWIGESGRIAYQPIPEVRSRLKCRGQVLASTKKVWYEVTLKEIGYSPDAFCLADALMYADGKPIVEITDMSVRLTGLSRHEVEHLWSNRRPGATAVHKEREGRPPCTSPLTNYDRRTAIFDTDRITAFAVGKPSDAFGDRYKVFDDERKIARLPGPPFQFLDRIVSIENCQPWKLEAGGEIIAQYDIPVDAWYFAANRQTVMPFAVLLETALQPCGWLAAYLGSALTSETDLSFRNLGGKAIQYCDVTPASGTLTTRVKITKVSQSGGMIIQNFDYHLSCNDKPVYVGDTYFGFFSKASLANQVGIRDAKVFVPSAEESSRARNFLVPDAAPFANSEYMMIDQAELLLEGGPHGLGYIRGTMQVDPSAWFFKAHFYQDPVVPGSLGLESFFQLMKFYAAARWNVGKDCQFQTPSLRLSSDTAKPAPHEWVYRGQVVPKDNTVTVTAVITQIDDSARQLTGEGFLSVDGRVIYQMKNFTVAVT